MIRHAVIAVVAWLCLTGSVVAQTLPTSAVPTGALIFPVLSGRVVDDAGLLPAPDREALTRSLADLEAKTTDQLVVVTLKTLQGRPIEDFGYQLGRAWGIGQKGKDSGALLIVAAAERKVRIEVGYGLEGTLTDAATKIIIEDTILPRFKTGDFPGGIKAGAAAIAQLLVGDAGGTRLVAPPSVQADHRQSAPMPVWLVIVLGLGGVGLLVFCTVTGGSGPCSVIMQVLFMLVLSGRGGSSRGKSSSFSGGGGSFGGGGSSGSW
jgi:uncharacterized protein